MTEKFTFWAQALDNSSPDHIEARGEELDFGDSGRRQEAATQVSRVIKLGNNVFSADGVQLTADNRDFVLEVPSVQRDRVGRIAPIVCYGNYSRDARSELGVSASTALAAFATRIGRTIQPEHVALVHKAFDVLKKKCLTRRIVWTIVNGILILAFSALAYVLVSSGLWTE